MTGSSSDLGVLIVGGLLGSLTRESFSPAGSFPIRRRKDAFPARIHRLLNSVSPHRRRQTRLRSSPHGGEQQKNSGSPHRRRQRPLRSPPRGGEQQETSGAPPP